MNISNEYCQKRQKAPRLKPTKHPGPRPLVEKDRPIPVELVERQTRRDYSKSKLGGARNFSHFYPFEDMEIGDSFWVRCETNCTTGAISKFSKKTGRKFLHRMERKDGKVIKRGEKVGKSERGRRVWRIK